MEIPELERIARLARLRLREEEKPALAGEMEAVLGLFRELDRAPAAEEPLHHVLRLESVFREDEPRPCLDPKAVLDNAAGTERGYVRGPRILAGKGP
ncbi:MAG: Asp-tRNA(Asn)/Glu-tRNA(Gln) amidotransferase subunit GatC [Halobacteria archaeon]